MWIPPQMTRHPFRTAPNAATTNGPTGAKMNGGIQGTRWKLIRSASPGRAHRTSELLIGFFSRSGEGIDLPALMDSNLGNDVCRASETVNPEVSGLLDRTCHHQRTVANQARAHQRGRLDVAVRLIQRKTKSRFGHGEFGVAAIDRVTGEPGVVTQVFPVCFAILTMAAGPAKPRDPDAGPHPEIVDPGTAFHNFSDNFMPGNERKFWVRQFAIHDMEIRTANGAGQHPHQHLSGTRRRRYHLAFAERGSRLFKNHRAHGSNLHQYLSEIRVAAASFFLPVAGE